MENKKLIQDTGLFIGQNLFKFSPVESIETISNLFQTIKEYREFTNPGEAGWVEYINDIFHILGFNTVKVAQRLIVLNKMEGNPTPKALVGIVDPKEDFNQIANGLDWESYLFYAAKFHQVDWAILTNGLQLKVLNFATDANSQKYFQCELDEIIKLGLSDHFFTLYKIFHVINAANEIKISNPKTTNQGAAEIALPNSVEGYSVHQEFWLQFLSRSKSKTQLFSKNTPRDKEYIGFTAGSSGVGYYCIITGRKTSIMLNIEKRKDRNWNKRAFDALFIDKQKIEVAFENSLVWDRLDEGLASKIRFEVNQFGLNDKEKWPELQDDMLEAMIKFEEVLRRYVQNLG